MKIIYISVILCFTVIMPLLAQDRVLEDTTNIEAKCKDDTTRHKISSFFSDKTDALIGSVFGKSRQLSNADSIRSKLDALPSFGIYKDNYIIIGTDPFRTPTEDNSDVKFQVSIRHRLTNSTLPFKTYLYLAYTQKAFWDVFKKSFPFRDLNFNPSIGIGKSLVRNNRFLGAITFQLEHESNGKSEEDSRSWNKASFGSFFAVDDYWTLHAKAWVPIVDGENNSDIVKYLGWGQMTLNYTGAKKKYNLSCTVVKRGGVNFDANVTLNFSIRLFSDDNQYLFAEYYDGYGESLLDYKEYRQRFRVGFVIKPDFMSMF